jgi:hypothetical protein
MQLPAPLQIVCHQPRAGTPDRTLQPEQIGTRGFGQGHQTETDVET